MQQRQRRQRLLTKPNMRFPDTYGKRVLAEIDSTNAEAARIAKSLSGPEWILALNQTAARGRRGRAWEFPKGNFAGTLVLQPNETPDIVALRSFVASLALYEAFIAIGVQPQALALKWPNDVLLNGGKVAGILLESIGGGAGVSHLAIGIGVNLADAPKPSQVETQALRPVSLVSETGVAIDPETFLLHLASAYARLETQFTTYGFAPIREAWLARAAKLGDVITARTMNSETVGTFETVDEQGNLILKTPQSRVAIAAADVFF